VTPPAVDILGLDSELKPHLRVEHADENDGIIDAYKAALNEIDSPNGMLGRSLITRTLRLTLDAPPPDVVRIPMPPVTAISTITYRDCDDVFQAIDSADYLSDLTAEPALVWPKTSWPSGIKGGPDTFRIEYVAGYANAASVPDVIKQWLKLRTGDYYRDRETVLLGITPTELPHIKRMLDNWRVR